MNEDLVPAEPTAIQAAADADDDAAPLIATKIQVPRLRSDLLLRRRLVSFVHGHLDRKLLLISAPAGYGKTTMLAHFAHDTELPVCWYTLDPFDQDLRVFVDYFIASIARRFPAFGRRSRAFVQTAADPGSKLYPIVATIVQEMYETIHEYFFLILDDHHIVEDQDAISEFLDLFITYADENCHLILASRTLPALPNLSLLVARRQAAGLSLDELRFTPQEIQALARQNYGLEVAADQSELLAQRTGGWITGLMLTAVPRWGEAQAEVPLRGRIGVDLYDYLSAQVLDRQPAPLRDFLLASSVLDELYPDLCAAVLGTEQTDDLLAQVQARNLFVTGFEEENQLRYHDLFRDFLQSSLRKQDWPRFRELTRRAAEAYAGRGEWERAVSRYTALQDYESVAQIIDRTARKMYATGRWDTLASWLDLLPEGMREAHPRYLLQRGKIHAERGEYDAALALLRRAERAFTDRGDQAQTAFALATIGSLLRFQGHWLEAMEYSKQALSLVSEATHQERLAGALAHKDIGLCQIGLGLLAEGRESLHRALRLYDTADDGYDVALVHHDLALSYERSADPERAAAYYQMALQSWQRLGNPGPWANTLNGLGVILYIQGKYDQALPIFEEALTKARQAGDRRVEAYTLASLGDLHRDLADYDWAQDAYEQALDVARQARIAFIVTYALDCLGNTFRLKGDLIRARKHLVRALEHAQSQKSTYEIGLCHMSLGILAGREGDLVAARRHLDQAVDLFDTSGFLQELSRACLYRAQVLFQAGQREASLVDLRRTLDQASQLGLDQFLVVEGRSIQPLLQFAARHGVGQETIPDLLRRIEQHQARPKPPSSPTLSEPRPVLKINSLGRILVELNGRNVQWEVTQSRDLFFYLLVSPQGVSKERIGEVFWPDYTPQKLDGIFRSTLYRLRRALFRESILFEEGLYRFNRATDFWFDAEVFERHLDLADQSATPETKMAQIEEALALYRGDYLVGIYADWPVLQRGRLRDRYVAALEALARLNRTLGNWKRAIEVYQRLLGEEPYYEVAHQELMRCHLQRGDRAAAIRQYQVCVQVLRDDLGISPAPETEAAYLEIIG